MAVSVTAVTRLAGACAATALALAPAAIAAPAPTIRTGDVEQYEGTNGMRTMSFPACISRVPASGSASAVFRTVPGSAKQGSDFTRTSTRLTWEADDPRCRIVEVPVKADARPEPTERFAVRLSAPANARITDPTAVARIKDDDQDPDEIVVDSAIYSIKAWTTEYPFALSCPADHPYVVFRTYSYYNYNAMYGLDMTRTSNSIAFFLPNATSKPDPFDPQQIVLTGMAAGSSGDLTTNNLTNYALSTENWQLHLHCTDDINSAVVEAP